MVRRSYGSPGDAPAPPMIAILREIVADPSPVRYRHRILEDV
jgi:hypothetical protein